MKTSILILKIILSAGLILSDNPVFSQGKFEISGGFGFPEWTNLKIRYGKVLQIGVSQSFQIRSLYPDYTKKIYMETTAAEIYYHFGGQSKFTEQPPWYLFGGLGCLWGHEGDENSVYFYPRLGRSINFSKRTGINLDAGAFIPFFKFFDIPILPSGSVSFFIRL